MENNKNEFEDYLNEVLKEFQIIKENEEVYKEEILNVADPSKVNWKK